MSLKNVYAENFVGGSYDYHASGESPQRCVNLIPEKIESASGKTAFCLRSLRALQLMHAEEGSCHGLYFDNAAERLWYSFGTSVYCLDRFGVETEVYANLSVSVKTVKFADNGQKLVMADGNALYACDMDGSNFAPVSLPSYDWNGTNYAIEPSNVALVSGSFVIDGAKQAPYGILFYSEPYSLSFTDSDGILNRFAAESSADGVVALAAVGGRLYIFGERSYEVWAASDDGFLSFVAGTSTEIGCVSRESVAVLGETVYWLGTSSLGHGSVWAAQGVQAPVRISTNAVEERLGEAVADAYGIYGFAYAEEGHQFYCLSARPSLSVCFDISTQLWHERASRDWELGNNLAWEPLFCATAFGDQVVFAGQGGLYVLSGLVGHDGKPVWRERVSPIYHADETPIAVRELLLDMQVATTEDLSARPVAMLYVATDEGKLYADAGWKGIGRTGRYRDVVRWFNVGYGRTFSARVVFSENCDVTLFALRLGIEEGSPR